MYFFPGLVVLLRGVAGEGVFEFDWNYFSLQTDILTDR
jgi:hypothetical protein